MSSVLGLLLGFGILAGVMALSLLFAGIKAAVTWMNNNL